MRLFSSIKDIRQVKYFSNVNKGIKPFLINEIYRTYSDKSIMVILENNNDIDLYYNLFKNFFFTDNIIRFPSWDSIPFEELSPSQPILNERFKSFNSIQQKKKNDSLILFTNLDALLQLVPNKSTLEKNYFCVKSCQELSLDQLNSQLNHQGYEKVGVVLEPYEYAVRGGIIDLWPIGQEHPYRVDFFDNVVESIRKFNPISQISFHKVDKIIICNSFESPRQHEANKIFIENYRNLFGPSANEELFIHKLKNDIKADGIENWLPLFYKDKLEDITEFFKPDIIISDDSFLEKTKNKLDEIISMYEEKKNMSDMGNESINSPIPPELFYCSYKRLNEIYNNNKFKKLCYLEKEKNSKNYKVNCKENIEFHNIHFSNDEIIQRLKKIIDHNKGIKKIILSYSSNKEKNKIIDLFSYLNERKFRDIKKTIEDCMDNLEVIDILLIPIEEGFELPLLKIITHNEIFKKKTNISPKKVRNNLIDIAQLQINDVIVHISHGIGKYLGLKTIKINNSPHDCLVIEYLEKSKLYVPVEDIRLISKFGEANENILLDKLGSGSWEKKRSNVKKRIRDLANSLITIAAKRSTMKGLKLKINQNKLENFSKSFNFIETDDQLATLDEVYKDLCSGKLMDRLVCGDVGFGKTEIALRASAVVTDNNFTVLIIAPTTLLARQHFSTFQKRFKNINTVGLIDRNINAKKKKEIIQEFLDKNIKILVSTHAIFSADLKDADLGLVIIDEEQRFGVSHKEKIKKIKSGVHLLTLTATPIPRTLHMSLMGIKDLSLIKTPPVDRKSIDTKVIKFDNAVIKKAIFREKSRSGQIYLVVPKVKDIPIIHDRIKSIYPNLRIGIAHGKLTAMKLESVMDNFYNYKSDLLISTTIVEAGLDIPKANTLIVYKSDNFGLAQLHQLRGRIGRSDKKAYSYFTLEKNVVSKNAVRRLKALQTMDDLGAGMQLANYDLDIRGAGNLLGEEQSGQISQVGIEMYQRLLKECMNDLKGEDNYINAEEIEVSIKLPILIPEKYIPNLSLRLSIYRKVGEFQEKDEMNLFKEEMINRFGIIPVEFSNYLDVMYLKLLCGKCSISKVYVFNKYYQITFNKKRKKYSESFIKWITDNKNKITLKDSHVIKIEHDIQEVKKQLLNIIDLTKNMLELLKN